MDIKKLTTQQINNALQDGELNGKPLIDEQEKSLNTEAVNRIYSEAEKLIESERIGFIERLADDEIEENDFTDDQQKEIRPELIDLIKKNVTPDDFADAFDDGLDALNNGFPDDDIIEGTEYGCRLLTDHSTAPVESVKFNNALNASLDKRTNINNVISDFMASKLDAYGIE